MSASSLGRNIPVLSKSRAIFIVTTDALSNILSDRREQLVPKNTGSLFHHGFSVKLVVLGFLKALYSCNTLREGSQCGSVLFFFLNHHIMDLDRE